MLSLCCLFTVMKVCLSGVTDQHRRNACAVSSSHAVKDCCVPSSITDPRRESRVLGFKSREMDCLEQQANVTFC
jgi:hypothetical protein